MALTKADLVDDDTIELVRLEVLDLVAGSFLDGGPDHPRIVPHGRRAWTTSAKRWLNWPIDAAGRRDDGIVRLPIDRAFSVKGFGTVVTGTLVSGRIERDVGPRRSCQTAGARESARGIEVHGDTRSGRPRRASAPRSTWPVSRVRRPAPWRHAHCAGRSAGNTAGRYAR